MPDDEIVVQVDYDPDTDQTVPVTERLPDVPPRAESNGWGDLSWLRRGKGDVFGRGRFRRHG